MIVFSKSKKLGMVSIVGYILMGLYFVYYAINAETLIDASLASMVVALNVFMMVVLFKRKNDDE